MKKHEIIRFVRELRKNQTSFEKALWNEIRNRKMEGRKFLRRHPIVYENVNDDLAFFIADFYCAEKMLIIEVDGAIHKFQKGYDRQRDLIIKDIGIEILRIDNEELREMEKVLEKIRKKLKELSSSLSK